VFVVLSVLMALLGTRVAHRFARLEHSLHGGRIEFGLAGEYSSGRLAHVRAIKTEPDASAHVGDVILGEVGIGAGCAGLSAGHACLDACDEQLAVQGSWPTMGLKQRFGSGHDSSSWFIFMRFQPGGVSRQHPHRLLTRVNRTAG
jgi:hypothetical protein